MYVMLHRHHLKRLLDHRRFAQFQHAYDLGHGHVVLGPGLVGQLQNTVCQALYPAPDFSVCLACHTAIPPGRLILLVDAVSLLVMLSTLIAT